MVVQQTPSSDSVFEQIKAAIQKRAENTLKKYSRKKNIKSLAKTVLFISLFILGCCYELKDRHINATIYSDDNAICESAVQDINSSLIEIANKYLNEFEPDMSGIETDSTGAWLLTITSDVGNLNEHDIVNFNKFINCSTKFVWTHPRNNLYCYWIEKDNKGPLAHYKTSAHYKTKDSEDLPAEDRNQENRQGMGRRHFHLNQKSKLISGDKRRVKMQIGWNTYRLEYVFNDDVCQKGGLPHVCKFEKDARIVHRAVIKLTYPWLGEFRLGTITAGLVPGQDRNTLRTLVVLGGPESRFHSSSRIVNSIVTPLVRYFKVSKSCAEDLYKHWSEEIYVSTKITQHLIQGN